MDDRQLPLLSHDEAEADPAARAFTALGQKIDLLEAAVAGLAAKRDAEPDYSETLGEIAALLERMRTAINGMARSPAMQLAPRTMAAEITAAGTTARAADSALIDRARKQLEEAAKRIERLTGVAATILEQRRRLLWAAGGGLFAGMLLWSFLPGVILRALPQSWHMPENMARHIIGEPTLWEAGIRMMQAGDPDSWQAIILAVEMRRDNREAIDACERKATKTRNAVRCTIRINNQQP
jgi:hypothetical protein